MYLFYMLLKTMLKFIIKNKKQKFIEIPMQPNAFIFALPINQKKNK